MLRVSAEIENLIPYKPGQSIEQTQRELGLKEIIKLASNENALGPNPSALKAIQDSLPQLHRYPDAAAFALTQHLAQHHSLKPEQILIGNGSNELIDLLIRTFCEPRTDSILIADKSFVAYEVCAQAARVGVVKLPQAPALIIDTSRLLKEVLKRKDVRMVFLPNPNNPTGTYVDGKELKSFVEGLTAWDGLIVIDEAYLEYVRAEDYQPALSFLKSAGNVVVLHTFSKVYGLAGLRVGALYGPEKVVNYLQRVRNPFNVNSLAQVAVLAALKDKSYIAQSQKTVWQGLDYFYREFSRLGLDCFPSQGNFVLFDVRMDGQKFFELVLQRGVILRPVGNYGLPTHIRMTVGLEAENQLAIKAIEAVLGQNHD